MLTHKADVLLLAENIQMAKNFAIYDCKWKQISSFVFLDHLQQKVKIVSDSYGVIMGLPYNTKVYLGPNWAKRKDARIIEQNLATDFFIQILPEENKEL